MNLPLWIQEIENESHRKDPDLYNFYNERISPQQIDNLLSALKIAMEALDDIEVFRGDPTAREALKKIRGEVE